MPALPLVYAPHPIFRQKCTPVETVDDTVRATVDAMFETLTQEQGIGLGAPMVGITQRIAVVRLQEEDGTHLTPYCFINPEIRAASEQMQTFEEASLCFPGISAPISRPHTITLAYIDYDGKAQELVAEGFLSTVIQHELDYLDGITYLDKLSPTKRDMLMRKMLKYVKLNPPHIHTEHCHH